MFQRSLDGFLVGNIPDTDILLHDKKTTVVKRGFPKCDSKMLLRCFQALKQSLPSKVLQGNYSFAIIPSLAAIQNSAVITTAAKLGCDGTLPLWISGPAERSDLALLSSYLLNILGFGRS